MSDFFFGNFKKRFFAGEMPPTAPPAEVEAFKQLQEEKNEFVNNYGEQAWNKLVELISIRISEQKKKIQKNELSAFIIKVIKKIKDSAEMRSVVSLEIKGKEAQEFNKKWGTLVERLLNDEKLFVNKKNSDMSEAFENKAKALGWNIAEAEDGETENYEQTDEEQILEVKDLPNEEEDKSLPSIAENPTPEETPAGKPAEGSQEKEELLQVDDELKQRDSVIEERIADIMPTEEQFIADPSLMNKNLVELAQKLDKLKKEKAKMEKKGLKTVEQKEQYAKILKDMETALDDYIKLQEALEKVNDAAREQDEKEDAETIKNLKEEINKLVPRGKELAEKLEEKRKEIPKDDLPFVWLDKLQNLSDEVKNDKKSLKKVEDYKNYLRKIKEMIDYAEMSIKFINAEKEKINKKEDKKSETASLAPEKQEQYHNEIRKLNDEYFKLEKEFGELPFYGQLDNAFLTDKERRDIISKRDEADDNVKKLLEDATKNGWTEDSLKEAIKNLKSRNSYEKELIKFAKKYAKEKLGFGGEGKKGEISKEEKEAFEKEIDDKEKELKEFIKEKKRIAGNAKNLDSLVKDPEIIAAMRVYQERDGQAGDFLRKKDTWKKDEYQEYIGNLLASRNRAYKEYSDKIREFIENEKPESSPETEVPKEKEIKSIDNQIEDIEKIFEAEVKKYRDNLDMMEASKKSEFLNDKETIRLLDIYEKERGNASEFEKKIGKKKMTDQQKNEFYILLDNKLKSYQNVLNYLLETLDRAKSKNQTTEQEKPEEKPIEPPKNEPEDKETKEVLEKIDKKEEMRKKRFLKALKSELQKLRKEAKLTLDQAKKIFNEGKKKSEGFSDNLEEDAKNFALAGLPEAKSAEAEPPKVEQPKTETPTPEAKPEEGPETPEKLPIPIPMEKPAKSKEELQMGINILEKSLKMIRKQLTEQLEKIGRNEMDEADRKIINGFVREDKIDDALAHLDKVCLADPDCVLYQQLEKQEREMRRQLMVYKETMMYGGFFDADKYFKDLRTAGKDPYEEILKNYSLAPRAAESKKVRAPKDETQTEKKNEQEKNAKNAKEIAETLLYNVNIVGEEGELSKVQVKASEMKAYIAQERANIEEKDGKLNIEWSKSSKKEIAEMAMQEKGKALYSQLTAESDDKENIDTELENSAKRANEIRKKEEANILQSFNFKLKVPPMPDSLLRRVIEFEKNGFEIHFIPDLDYLETEDAQNWSIFRLKQKEKLKDESYFTSTYGNGTWIAVEKKTVAQLREEDELVDVKKEDYSRILNQTAEKFGVNLISVRLPKIAEYDYLSYLNDNWLEEGSGELMYDDVKVGLLSRKSESAVVVYSKEQVGRIFKKEGELERRIVPLSKVEYETITARAVIEFQPIEERKLKKQK